MKRIWIILIVGVIISPVLMAQRVKQVIQTGNDFYRQKKYDEAVAQYNKAIILEPPNTTATFNLANAYYRQGKEDEAIKTFTDLPGNTTDKELRSKAYYNKGVVLSREKKLEESIEAYKNALRQNPNDAEARENLQKALLELKKKEPPKKKEDQDKKKKQQQQQQQKQPKMNPKEAQQRLKLLEQKEKEVQQRMQKEKANTGGGQGKDW